MAKIQFPIDDVCLSFVIHDVDADVPILFYIDGMDRIGEYFSNLTNRLYHSESGRSALVLRINGHPFLTWIPVGQCHFTRIELSRLHRRFGHPAAAKIAFFSHAPDLIKHQL